MSFRSLLSFHVIRAYLSVLQIYFEKCIFTRSLRSSKEKAANSRREMFEARALRIEEDLAWQHRPPVADDIDQAERWPRPGSLSRRCDPVPAFRILPRHPLPISLSLSFSRLLGNHMPHAATRCSWPPVNLAADYERVRRRYCSSRVHARARQHRRAGQSRRRHGSAVSEGPPRQSGRYVPCEGEWSLSRNWIATREIVSRDYPSSLDLPWLLWLFIRRWIRYEKNARKNILSSMLDFPT